MFWKKNLRLIVALTLSVIFVVFQHGAANAQDTRPDIAKQKIKYPSEIVVKFKPQVGLPYQDGVESKLQVKQDPAINAALADVPQLKFNRLFKTLNKSSPSALAQAKNSKAKAAVFEQYYTALVPEGADIDRLLKQLKSSPLVEEAYLKPQPVEAPGFPSPNSTPVESSDDPYFPLQGYAQFAPEGINSPYAWQFEGGDGKGIKWVDVEQGWAFGHEDLVAHNIQLLPGGISAWYHGHGTAVLGQISAVDNTIGNLGLASKAQPYAASQHRVGGSYNTAEAILSAVSVLSAGDVILLEAQTGYPTANGYIPVEVYPAEFDAIQYATSLGITVVEAAGNGSVDLDSFQTTDGKYIFNPNSPDFKDSGAIIIGAASGSVPHYRLGFSTYGNRIDAFGWGGWDVSTLDAVDGDSTTGYQTGFSGTSSASPIVTSAAISIQGIAKVEFGAPYSPAELRRLLKSAAYNTPSYDPATDKIGYMPNLKEIIDNHLAPPGTVPIDSVAPSAPSNVTATDIQETYATISWAAATDNNSLIGYDVFVNGSFLPATSTSQTSATLYSLAPATTYSVTVKARDGAHNLSAASTPLSVTTLSSQTCVNSWNAYTIYTNGHQASYNGILYQAKWWTQNQRPDLHYGPNAVWTFISSC